jgi:uncharacterized protein YktA (UPF0223 family)
MNLELYGKYREFKEVGMSKRLEKLVDPGFCERWDRAVDKAEKRGISQGASQIARAILWRCRG